MVITEQYFQNKIRCAFIHPNYRPTVFFPTACQSEWFLSKFLFSRFQSEKPARLILPNACSMQSISIEFSVIKDPTENPMHETRGQQAVADLSQVSDIA